MLFDDLSLQGVGIAPVGATQTGRSASSQRGRGLNARPGLTARKLCPSLLLAALLIGTCQSVSAQGTPESAPAPATLFRGVRIFDGKSAALSASSDVLITGNIIERISANPITVDGKANVRVVSGDGRVLMPGLIDAHWHAALVRTTPAQAFGDSASTLSLAGDEATATLMRGFTTIRDMGGPVFGLKRAIDEGIVKGPRIYPSGAVITVTSGHGDFRQLTDLPRTIGGMLTRMEQLGGSMVADSPDEVRLRVREQLMQGASQIKLTAGGGVASPFSPIDVTTFTEAELRAAVEAAENWGTYVAAHAFTPAAIQRSIAAGVKCIEHGMLMDEATAKLIAEKGIWLSTQPLPEDLRLGFPVGSVQRAKADRGLVRHRQDLRVGEEVQDQDGVGHRRAVFPRAGAATRGHSGLACPLVHAQPKRWSWRHRQTPNCWRCPASAIPIPASSASWKRARSPTCCWSTAIRWRTSSSSQIRKRTS